VPLQHTLVDEDKPVRLKAHARLAQSGPLVTLPSDLGTPLLAGQQRFF
jgi:hypothetical protein